MPSARATASARSGSKVTPRPCWPRRPIAWPSGTGSWPPEPARRGGAAGVAPRAACQKSPLHHPPGRAGRRPPKRPPRCPQPPAAWPCRARARPHGKARASPSPGGTPMGGAPIACVRCAWRRRAAATAARPHPVPSDGPASPAVHFARGIPTKVPVRVAVTGAAGQIGYALLFRIASGEMLGKDQPVILQLLELPMEKAQAALKGVMMELEDCAFPLLAGMVGTDDPEVAFKDADYALLVGARPRGPG